MVSRRWFRLKVFGAALLLALVLPAQAQSPGNQGPPSERSSQATSGVKPDPHKAKEAFERGSKAERGGDWQAAYEAYTEAGTWAPTNRDYLLRREIARSHVVQEKVDSAERDAVSGRLADARAKLRAAQELDPSNSVVRDRLAELSATQRQQIRELLEEPAGPVQLEYRPGKRNLEFRGDTQGAYELVAREFGVDVAFDAELHARPVRFQLPDVDFPVAIQALGNLTGTFVRPLTRRLFFVAENTAQKRKDYDVSVARTVLLPASKTPEEMTEMSRLVREIAGIWRSDLDTRSRTLTLRGSPRAMAIATDLIDELEKPAGELVLEIEILEVNRNYARQLGITPPESAQIFTLSKQQIQEAEQSLQGLVTVLTQVFGQPSSLTGLTSAQIASLLSSGQVSVASLIPPLVAFGGGKTIWLARLPGASANFAAMLSLVQTGRRVLLRAEDGRPATFFVGDRIPISLAQFSASLGGPASSVPGVNTSNFPRTDLTTGAGPDFVTTGDLRNKKIQDLMVANHTDNTVSVFLGNGDGTFGNKTDFPTGTAPVWIATGDFNGDKNLDIAVADQTANTISILLGNGDGTFRTKTDIASGTGPISVAAADLNGDGKVDLVVVNHTDNTLSILLGNGDGTFSPPPALAPAVISTGRGPTSIATGDFNGDGKVDLAVTNQTDNTVSVFLGNGDGTFRPRVDNPTGNSPLFVAVADLNGDNIPDLAVANNGDNTVSILFGNGNGTFAAKSDFAAGNGPTAIAVADFNIDGRPDLAVTDQHDNAVSILLGIGSGLFAPNFELPVGTNPVSDATADFVGNGRPDLATANMTANTASVILNSTSFTTVNGQPGTLFPGAQYLDVGVKVKATPRLHLDDEVTLQLQFEISSLSGQSINSIPIITNRKIEQTVRLKNNETTALAGILEEQEMRSIGGTPGLAELEGLGYLAGNRNTQAQDTELLILVTPRMVLLAPRKDHVVYAGQGSPEGPTGIAPPRPESPRP